MSQPGSLTLPVLTLSGLIQRWVQIDNQVKQINDEVRELRESRNNVESSILAHVADNNLSHATVRSRSPSWARRWPSAARRSKPPPSCSTFAPNATPPQNWCPKSGAAT